MASLKGKYVELWVYKMFDQSGIPAKILKGRVEKIHTFKNCWDTSTITIRRDRKSVV